MQGENSSRAPLPLRAGQSVLEQSPGLLPYVVYVYDLDRGLTEYQNRHLAAELGYTEDEIAAMGGHVLEILAHPDDVRRFPELFARWATVRDGEVLETEYRMRHKDGRFRWYLGRDTVLERDPSGRVVRIVGTALDITAHKQLEAQLRQAQKLEALGRFAGGIAHDFNNILTAILGHVELCEADPTDVELVKESLREVRAASMQAASLTGQLLAFAREQVLRPEVVDPNEQVRQCMMLLQRIIGEDIVIALELTAGVHPILVDRSQFVQLMMNLVLNAKDAMPRGGRITIRTRSAHLPGQPELQRGAGDYAVLEVEDEGTGMSADVRARIFDPFFTTKPVGKGTGLGLSTVHGIIHQLGGFLDVDSEPGRGTCFTLYFPRAVEETELTPAPRAVTPPQAARASILIVEDEPAIQSIESTVLTRAGHDVSCARSAEEAERAVASRGAPFDLLITDLVLPGLSGLELADRLRSQNPALRVLCTSGYVRLPDERAELEQGGVRFLAKPFTPAEFLAEVSRVLSR